MRPGHDADTSETALILEFDFFIIKLLKKKKKKPKII